MTPLAQSNLEHGQGVGSTNIKQEKLPVDHVNHFVQFVQGLDMLSTGRLSQTLIHPRRLLTLLRKVICDVTICSSIHRTCPSSRTIQYILICSTSRAAQ